MIGNAHVPISIHELIIERHFKRDPISREKIADPVLEVMHAAVRSARLTAEACVSHAAEIRSDELNSKIANELTLARVTRRLCQGPLNRLDRAHEKAESALCEFMKATCASPAKLDRISILKKALTDLDRARRLFEKFIHGIADQVAVRTAEELERTSGRGSGAGFSVNTS